MPTIFRDTEMGVVVPDIDNPSLSAEAFADSVLQIQRQVRTWLYRRQDAAQRIQHATRYNFLMVFTLR